MYWPIYEAACEMKLPVSVHPGTEGRGISNGFIAGAPTSYLEWHTNLPQNYMGQVVSLVLEGIFEKFPELIFVAKEGGLGWIPGVLWRLDKNWKGLRSTVPWLKRPPSEVIIDHIRFTSQPVEEPEKPAHFMALMEMIHAEKTLMFSSDYPHWDNDSPEHGLPRLPDDLADRIYYKNADAVYRFSEKAALFQ
jgi:predicted TIM-barrel fold metal-dependent hydrolase